MRLTMLAAAVLLSAAPLAAPAALTAAAQSRYTPSVKDLMSIEAMFDRYFQGYDQHDNALMASAFTESGQLSHIRFGKPLDTISGRAAITALRRGPQGVEAGATPVVLNLWHLMTNSHVTFTGPTSATHYAYWMNIRLNPDGTPTVGVPGHYEDVLIKQNGEWLIQDRKIFIGTK